MSFTCLIFNDSILQKRGDAANLKKNLQLFTEKRLLLIFFMIHSGLNRENHRQDTTKKITI